MAKQNLTPWFPPHIKPVRPGAYNASASATPNEAAFRYWDGKHWRGFSLDSPEDLNPTGLPSVYQDQIQWRGLAENPHG